MTNRVFLDSNIWVYFFSDDKNPKADVVERFLADNAIESVFFTSCQVVNEVSNVLKRNGLAEEKIRFVIEEMTSICLVQDLSKDVSLLASKLREKYSFSFWDSIIVAAAKTAACHSLISEDMQDGLVVDGLGIKNIF
ncbi:MAG: PIN domain-containing protein [Planctomycetaceae bacterium]|nr:PIN domain-containing protein [Planctomycetaceae bacterium]